MVFGLMRVVNLTHGSYYAFAGYIGYSVSQYTHSFILALLAGMATGALIGFLMERYLFRMIYNKELEQIILTFGFIYIFQDIFNWIWAGRIYTINNPSMLSDPIKIMSFYYPSYRLSLIAIGTFFATGLWYLREKTLLGAIIRAGVDDLEMIRAMGIKITNYFTLVFVMGSSLAGIAGILGAPFVTIYPGMDMEILILALIVIVLGGMESMTGCLWASLIIGTADAFGKIYLPQFAVFSIYAVMVLVLMIKPSGLMGRKD